MAAVTCVHIAAVTRLDLTTHPDPDEVVGRFVLPTSIVLWVETIRIPRAYGCGAAGLSYSLLCP